MRQHLLVIGFFAIATVVITWPLVLHPATFVFDEGDPLLTSCILAWVNRALVESPGSLFDAPAFYPDQNALAFSETLLLPAVIASPVFALGGSPILAHNFTFLLSFVLGGWFFYLMCRELGLDVRSSLMGSFLFDFAAFRMNFSHLQLSQVQYLPLQVFFLNRYFRSGQVRCLFGAWLAMAATVLSCSYYGVYALLLMGLLHLFYLTALAKALNRRTVVQIVSGPFPAVVCLLPYYLKYLEAHKLSGFSRQAGDLLPFQADLVNYATYFYHNLIFAKWTAELPGSLYWYGTPGICAAALAVIAVVCTKGADAYVRHTVRRGLTLARYVSFGIGVIGLGAILGGLASPEVVPCTIAFYVGLAVWLVEILWQCFTSRALVWPSVLAWLALFAMFLSLGLEVHVAGKAVGPGIYGVFHSYFPGFWGIRAVYRISVLFFLAISMLGAFGVDALQRRGWLRQSTFMVLFAVAFVEHMNKPIPWVRHEERDEAACHWLATRSGRGAVLALPFGGGLDPYLVQYQNVIHRRPLINGVSGFIPASYMERVRLLETYPSQSSFDLLQSILPLEYIMWRSLPKELVPGNPYLDLDSVPFLKKEARLSGTTIYRVLHDFSTEQPRDSLRLLVDPQRMGGSTLVMRFKPPGLAGAGTTVEVRFREQLIASVGLARTRQVEVDLDKLTGRGWLDLQAVSPGPPSRRPVSWELRSDCAGNVGSYINVGGRLAEASVPHGIVVAVTDGQQDHLRARSFETTENEHAAGDLRGFIKRWRKKRYFFLVVAGDGLRKASDGVRETVQRIARRDSGSDAFALVLIRPRSGHGSRLDIRSAAGHGHAVLSDFGCGFVLTNLRIR